MHNNKKHIGCTELVDDDEAAHGDGTKSKLNAKVNQPGNVDRRRFLQMTGATAAVGGMIGASNTAAASHSPEDPYTERFVHADSSNYSTDWRDAGDINWIVVHVTVGSYSGAVSWFQNASADVSANYVISNYEETAYAPGHTTQMVQHKDMAWHAGGSNTPSIGIEHEWYDGYGEYISDECYQRSGQLISWLCDEYNIPKTFYSSPTCIYNEPGGIIGHTHTPNGTACSSYNATQCPYPSGGIDPSTLMSYVDGGDDGGDGGLQMDDDVQTTVDLNGREGPGLSYNVVDTYTTGTQGYIMNGPETSDGYTWWGVHFPAPNDWVWCAEQYLEEI